MIAYKRTMIFDGSVFGHLQEQNVRPEHMAVDKPSDKFLAFLRKHYGLSRTIPQINNFVVFDAFFQDRPSKCLLWSVPPHLFSFFFLLVSLMS